MRANSLATEALAISRRGATHFPHAAPPDLKPSAEPRPCPPDAGAGVSDAMTTRQILCGAALMTAACLPAPCHAQAPRTATPSADSVAAAVARQLDIGEKWFLSACVSCHAIGAVNNPDFRLKWSGQNAYTFFERIRSTMPANKPGSLTQGTYASIVAYLLKLNGMAVGKRTISSDSTALASILLKFPATPR